MATGPSNTTTLSELVGQIVSEFAQSAAYANRVMRNLVTAREVPQGAGSIVIPRFQTVPIAALTQGTAPDARQWNTDGVTLTPVERGALVTISKSVLWADPWSDLEPYGEQLGRAMGADEDKLMTALFTGFTGNVINAQVTTGNDVDLADFLDAIGKLEAQSAPAPYYGVFHPVSWGRIRKELDDAAVFAAVGTKIVEGFGEGKTNLAGYVGNPYGVPCFMTSGVVEKAATSTVTSIYENLLFSKEAIGYAYTYDATIDVDDNVPARAFDVMAWYAGHAAELVDLYGCKIEDKGATAPTG